MANPGIDRSTGLAIPPGSNGGGGGVGGSGTGIAIGNIAPRRQQDAEPDGVTPLPSDIEIGPGRRALRRLGRQKSTLSMFQAMLAEFQRRGRDSLRIDAPMNRLRNYFLQKLSGKIANMKLAISDNPASS